MFKRILIPVDRSALAEQAVGQAAAIARASGAELDLVLVHEPMAFDGYADAPWNADALREARKYLARLDAEIESGSSLSVVSALLKGEPVDMICRRITDVRADLVVMTSHGRTGLSRAWMGSVAEGVLRHSTVPVLVLRPTVTKRQRDAGHHLFKHLLVPVDGSPLSAEVVGSAAALAQCGNGRITLLRVVQPIPIATAEPGFAYIPPFVDEAATSRLVDEANEKLVALAARLRNAYGVAVDANVTVHPLVAAAIIDVARANDVDLIAMSTHGRGMSRFVMGSVADKVVRGSGMPTLVYRPLRTRGVLPTKESASEPSATTGSLSVI